MTILDPHPHPGSREPAGRVEGVLHERGQVSEGEDAGEDERDAGPEEGALAVSAHHRHPHQELR